MPARLLVLPSCYRRTEYFFDFRLWNSPCPVVHPKAFKASVFESPVEGLPGEAGHGLDGSQGKHFFSHL